MRLRWQDLALALAFPLLATAQLPGDPSCRLQPGDIRPVLPPNPPGLHQYQWDATNHRETARLPGGLQLDIQQHGCLRHHIAIRLLAPASASPAAANWTAGQVSQQLLALLDLVWGTDATYAEYRPELAGWLARAWPDGNWRRPVTLPVADRSFYIQASADAVGTILRIEIVRLVPAAPLRPNGIQAYLDDGWKPDAG